MVTMVNNSRKKIMFSNVKKNYFMLKSGNICIEYIKQNRIYKMKRTDGKTFDGITEYTDSEYYGNAKPPQTLDELIEIQIMLLTSAQLDPEANMFDSLYWNFNEDKTEILIYPVYQQNKDTIFYQSADENNSASVILSFGNKIRALKR